MMSGDSTAERSPVPERVPTLTEVIDAYGFGEAPWNADATDWRAAGRSSADLALGVDAEPVVGGGTAESTESVSDVTVDEQDGLIQALQAALARVDAADDSRLRVALQPLIARFTDGLVAAVRMELASSLRELTASQNPGPSAPPPDLHGLVSPSA